ncbi:unnamed protein product, partial [Brassica rapa]
KHCSKSLVSKVTAFSVIYRRHSRLRLQSSSVKSGSATMGKSKARNRSSPPKLPLVVEVPVSTEADAAKATGSTKDIQSSSEVSASQNTASESKLQDPISGQSSGSEKTTTVATVETAKVLTVTDPATNHTSDDKEEGEISPLNPKINFTKKDSWTGLFKGNTKKLQKKGESFMLPSGETCVTIPNSVIEKNIRSWESFIIGQFYSDPPSQGTIQTIVNGIWSKQFRDITVSKMEGFAFLLRIPNASTRAHVLKQCLWQIEGQTVFVAKWEPGIVPVKPELTSAPIWLELRDVPLQFFNEEALEHIASQVGDPKFLHPHTANKTNLEVAKVFTIIDPRVPLPEAVNARFESGEIRRIRVSSPWMPPVCSFCKEVGHSLKRCKKAPITCKFCKSTGHLQSDCTRAKGKSSSQPANNQRFATPSKEAKESSQEANHTQPPSVKKSKASFKKMEKGETSITPGTRNVVARDHHPPEHANSETSPAESDSSDVDSSDSQFSDDSGFQDVVSSRQKKKERGRGPKIK